MYRKWHLFSRVRSRSPQYCFKAPSVYIMKNFSKNKINRVRVPIVNKTKSSKHLDSDYEARNSGEVSTQKYPVPKFKRARYLKKRLRDSRWGREERFFWKRLSITLKTVPDTQSDSIQFLNFAKKRFIQYFFTQDSIQNIIQLKKILLIQFKR